MKNLAEEEISLKPENLYRGILNGQTPNFQSEKAISIFKDSILPKSKFGLHKVEFEQPSLTNRIRYVPEAPFGTQKEKTIRNNGTNEVVVHSRR